MAAFDSEKYPLMIDTNVDIYNNVSNTAFKNVD